MYFWEKDNKCEKVGQEKPTEYFLDKKFQTFQNKSIWGLSKTI